MVNKPHAPRNAKASGNKATASTLNGEDTSYIVFGNDQPGKKTKQKKGKDQDAPKLENGSGGGGNKAKSVAASTSAAPEADKEKKPDTRTLIGGASWTGKLPQTLFNEHCQKQKWERPEYTVHRTAKGFTGGVIIKFKNAKTQELNTLPPIVPPPDYLKERGTHDSAVEARHFAAAYALFRVSNMKNIHMMLPPRYRDLWKGDFQDLKSEAVAQGNAYLYEADPFLAKRQHDEAKAAKEKARADKAKQQVEDKKLEVVSLDGQVQSKHVLKGWMRVPKVDMGLRTRRTVERLIRQGGAWNPNQVLLSQKQRQHIVDELSNIGFRKSHVQEAAEICKDKEECLEWLLIHVPEDDLPKWTLPDNYLAGVSMASGDLKREGKIQRLAASGYSPELCADMLESCNGDEGRTAQLLQSRLLGEDAVSADHAADSALWDEELATSAAIFGERFTSHDRVCTTVLELQTPTKKPILLRARPPTHGYPYALPILSLEADLPAYVRLSILKKVLLIANEEFFGVQMLFSIIDWLEQHIPLIIENPGKLSEVANATATSFNSSMQPAKAKSRKQPKPISWTANTHPSQEILDGWLARQSSPDQLKMLQVRQNLPAWSLRVSIVEAVTNNQVTIISGETGSGKSTQSVQFILDDLIQRSFGEQANIICTQPRRISALGLADRVADERCVKVGEEVGYAIRGESKQQQGVTKITFVTTGVLLRRLQTSGGSIDDVVRSLADVSHVVIDEVHERSLDTDFLLVLLRNVLQKRKDLKLVLMSATLDAQMFESYFSSSCSVGKVEIQGRTYPVTDCYLDDIVRMTGFGSVDVDEDSIADMTLDDRTTGRSGTSTPTQQKTPSIGNALRAVGTRINYDLIAQTVQCIDQKLGRADGGILIFLPGVAEIDQTLRALRSVPNLHALPLHASLQSSEQRRVFPRPPHGMRKVVAATNVAETSITIEDIVAVIDTGRVKETSFDPANNMVRLAEVWASRAACKQRRGRAGRVRAGECYKLYTRSAEAKMAERPEPEIRRVPLEQLCLSVRAMGVADVPNFLASALTPPETLAVEGALKLLARMGLLDGIDLTALGSHLSLIPADLRCGKLLVYGAAFGCLDACLTIAAILTVKSPFVSPQAKRDEAKAARGAFGKTQGDLICDLHAYEEWSARRLDGETTSSLRRWCDANFLNHQTLLDISTNRTQYLASLQETGFLPPSYNRSDTTALQAYNRHNGNEILLRALIAGSFQPQNARIEFPDKKYAASSSGAVELDPEARTIKYFNEENGRVFVHPSSTLFDAQSFSGNSVYMSYFTKMATSKVFIRDLTPFNVYSLLMFSGPITIDPQGRGLLVDGWIRLRGWARIGVLVSRMRRMFDELLARKLEDPGLDVAGSDVVELVRGMVEFDGLDR